jgi:putative DNA primase/helicase
MTTLNDTDRIAAALVAIDPSDRETWVRMAMAVKSELGDDGFAIWNEWSEAAANYNPRDARDVWRSVSAAGGISIATLYREARANGWTDDQRPPTATATVAARDHQRQAAVARTTQDAADLARIRATTAAKAAAVLAASAPVGTAQPYLLRKGLAPLPSLYEIDATAAAVILGYVPNVAGVLLSGQLLVVSVYRDGELATLELIDGEGRKAALAGRGTKQGGYWSAIPLPATDSPDDLTLVIAEGMATGLSLYAATQHPTVAALASVNLGTVARALRSRYPAARLILAADLVKATGQPDHHAIEAARASHGELAIPDFGPDRDPDETDFNDLHQRQGLAAVARALAAATAPPAAPGAPRDPGTAPTFPDEDHRPRYVVVDDWRSEGGRKIRPGVYYCGLTEGRRDQPPAPVDLWLCSPLHVEALTFDGAQANFGRYLRFQNSLGNWRHWSMPMELLKGQGDELRGELLAMGAELDPKLARLHLPAYLQGEHPKRRMHCALQVGWHGSSFVLPDIVIGPAADEVIFQAAEAAHDDYTRSGTLAGWREAIARVAVGNPLLILGLSAAFAGPLLAKVHGESGGVHLVGDSSSGKTTVIEAACAIWGGESFRRSWRATANGLEAAAAVFNDNTLALDEISEADPREIGSIIYALGNGRGKQRASRTGTARGVTRWRVMLLSSGERSIATSMAEGGSRVKAGQSLRLLDLPVNRRHGAWDQLHEFPTGGALADHLKAAAKVQHGHAGRAFLEKLTRDPRDFPAALAAIRAHPDLAADQEEGQVKRASARFAVMALAGELATEYGITGWPTGTATAAAATCYQAWRSQRGSGNDETRAIAQQVADFIARHGDSRFSAIDTPPRYPVRDRAGWLREQEGSEFEVLFTSEGLREATKGFDFKRALDVLQALGALAAPLPSAKGERARLVRIDGRAHKLYGIDPDRLDPAAAPPRPAPLPPPEW